MAATASFTVTDRTWTGSFTADVQGPTYSYASGVNPANKTITWGKTNFYPTDGTQVLNGPNTDLWYYVSIPIIGASVNFHWALSPTSPWYSLQTGTGGKCGATQVEQFKDSLRRHEGLPNGSPAARSHVGLLLNRLNTATTTLNFKSSAEEMVGNSDSNLRTKLNNMVIAAQNAILFEDHALDTADVPRLLNVAEATGSCSFAF